MLAKKISKFDCLLSSAYSLFKSVNIFRSRIVMVMILNDDDDGYDVRGEKGCKSIAHVFVG